MWTWCCFCGCPFDYASEGWLDVIRFWDQPEEGDLSFTPPPAPMQTLVTIPDEEGERWNRLVCVGPTFDNYVSRHGMRDSGNGDFLDLQEYGIVDDDDDPFLPIHIVCLSFLCRRINATPEQIWDSVYSEGSDYPVDTGKRKRIGLLKGMEYYDIDEYHGEEYFVYCLVKTTPKKDPEEGELELEESWLDPDSMLPLQWILSQPYLFPPVPSLDSSVPFASSLTTASPTPFMKVFKFPEILDIILNYVIGLDIPQSQLEEELKDEDVFTPPSIMQCTEDIFALLQVNRTFYTAIVRDRQHVFLRLAWMHGWMLPSTPEDWDNWGSRKPFHNGSDFKTEDGQDWRKYLLEFLDPEDDNVASRWRFHKMAMQFGRGRVEEKDGKQVRLRFPVGELAFRPDVKAPEPWFWEFGGEYPRGEDEDEDEYGCHC